MTQRKKAVFNWSGGKDSALALYKILQEGNYEVVSLLTVLNEETQTSSIHAIPLELLARQAASIGIPLYSVAFAKDLTNYEEKMREIVLHFKKQGVTHFIFGDLYLSEVKAHRERKLNPMGIEVVEPLWGRTATETMEDFLRSGIRSKIIVTQADKLDETYIGKELDRPTVNSFPCDIDICGENGEYHSFSYEGGLFREAIDFSISETKKISYDIKLANGQTEIFEYWQAELKK